MNILYLTYDGLTDHIGQSQVLPYLLGCAAAGHRITVVSFEKRARMETHGQRVRQQCSAVGMDWRPQRFRSSPPLLAKAIDLVAMRKAAFRTARKSSFDLVHCRSYPAASVGLRLKHRFRIPLLFDMRGFWPDQRREGGRWRADTVLGRTLYAQWKKLEAALYTKADHIVTLTAAARDVVAASPDFDGAPISVIPCCADFDLFRPDTNERASARTELGVPENAPVLVYLGSLGTVYRLDALLGLFAAARDRLDSLKLLFIGSGDADSIFEEARRLGIALEADDIRTVTAARADVPRWLNAGDVGLCFCAPSFSSLGVSATKVGEYLACGLPVIGNRQIGDLERIVAAVGTGCVLPDLTGPSIAAAGDKVETLLHADRAMIRDRASRFLDLRTGIRAYRQIYDDLRTPVSVEPPGDE